MGKPKVPNGVRLSIKLPEDALIRLKIECVERKLLESSIVLDALQTHWNPPVVPKVHEDAYLLDFLTPEDRTAAMTRFNRAQQAMRRTKKEPSSPKADSASADRGKTKPKKPAPTHQDNYEGIGAELDASQTEQSAPLPPYEDLPRGDQAFVKILRASGMDPYKDAVPGKQKGGKGHP